MIKAVNEQAATLLYFGGFTLDPQRRGLYKDGQRIHLTSKPLETLIYLVQNRERAVGKKELMEAVWEAAFVTEDTLVHAVMEIRQALSDDKDDPRFIQTVPRHGYRFVSTVNEERPQKPGSITAMPSLPDVAFQSHGRKSKGYRRAVVLGLSLLTLIAAALVVHKFSIRNRTTTRSQIPFESSKWAKLTTNGKVTDAVVLPGGRYVIYALNEDGQESLWLKQIATASNVRIAEPSDLAYQGLSVSTDGNYLYYVGLDRKLGASLYRMPVLGGVANRLIEDIDSAVTFSPDGKRIAFFRGYPQSGETALIVANADGTTEQKLVTNKRPDFFPTLRVAPEWSPNGKVIACPAGRTQPQRYVSVFEVRADDGTIIPLTTKKWKQISGMAWLSDGSGLILTAKQDESSPFQIWHLSYPDGKALQLTNDLNNYLDVSLTADSKDLITLQSQPVSNIWISPDGVEDHARQITSSNLDGQTGLNWTPDGRIVYVSRTSGHQDIWIMDQNGEHQRQLTTDSGDNKWPSVSEDGRFIVFMSNRTGVNHIWRMNIEGSNVVQLTNGNDERWPQCTPDGQSVLFAASDGVLKLHKISINGGSWTQLTSNESNQPVVSPDGKLVATTYFDDQERIKAAIYLITGGPPVKILDFWSSYFQWAPDGRSLQYVDRNSVANIISHPIHGGGPKQLTNLKTGGIAIFDWSHSGQLAWARTATTADVILLTDGAVR